MRKNQLHEVQWFNEAKYDVLEENGAKKYVVKAPFTRVDFPNGNNRVYPRKVMQDAINKLRPRVINKEITMMVDHPDWQASLRNTGALLVDITDVDENGFAYYEAQIADTAAGKDLKALIDLGAKLGVSTRGYGNCNYDQELPGFPGKFDVVSDGFELETIDFVDDPSVKDTKTYVQYESKQRSTDMYKTVAELKKAFPELMEQHKAEIMKDVETLTESKDKEVESLKENAKNLSNTVKTLAESIKTVCPDIFNVITDETLVENHQKALAEAKQETESVKAEKENLEKQIKESEAKAIADAKDAQIATFEAKHPEFFKLDVFANIFESCATKEDVETVFNKNFEIYTKIKNESNAAAEPKSKIEDSKEPKVNGDEKVLENGLTEAQNSDFEARNNQRRRGSLDPLTVDDYKRIIGI